MARSRNQATDSGRLSPTSESRTTPTPGINAHDSEDYDLNPHAVSDGFRPSPVAIFTPDVSRIRNTTQTPSSRDSLTLRNDGSASARRRDLGPPVQPFVSSGWPLVQPENSAEAPPKPVQPLPALRDTVAQPTASTASPLHRQSYHGPRGPTHPYALYEQNTVSGEEASVQETAVGLNASNNSYQRQIGPDGEEVGGLIGPLGHLEELPPYTRYPEESYASSKPSDSARDESTSSNAQRSGLGVTGADFSSPNGAPHVAGDAASLQSRISSPTGSSNASQHEINTAARDIAEKPATSKWQNVARRKLWGVVPYWAICLLITGLIVVGVVMGAVIGTVLAKHRGTDSVSPSESGSSSKQGGNKTFDVTPLDSLPTGLPPLPTGGFTLPPFDTTLAPRSCFVDNSQRQAWSCDLPFEDYSLKVMPIPDRNDTNNYAITLLPYNSSEMIDILGTQLPSITSPEALSLVDDVFERARGPAWWMRVTYNKTVIITENSLSGPNSKRDVPGPVTTIDLSRLEQIDGNKKGSDPKFWICTWPDTTLEIFIYPNQNSSRPVSTKTVGQGPPSARTTGAGATSTYLPTYPRVVKMLERRWNVDSDATARCRKARLVKADRTMVDMKDSNGKPIEVMISESKKSLQEQISVHKDISKPSKRWMFNPLSRRRVLELSDCGCLWWSA